MNERLTILQGDCLSVLKTLPDESVQCVVRSLNPDPVKLLRCQIKRLHLLTQSRRAVRRTGVSPTPSHPGRFTFLFYDTKRQCVFRLRLFHSQERQNGTDAFSGSLVCDGPRNKRFSAFGAWLGYIKRSPKGLPQKFWDRCRHLPQRHALGICWLLRVASHPHGIRASLDADGAVRINRASQVA